MVEKLLAVFDAFLNFLNKKTANFKNVDFFAIKLIPKKRCFDNFLKNYIPTKKYTKILFLMFGLIFAIFVLKFKNYGN